MRRFLNIAVSSSNTGGRLVMPGTKGAVGFCRRLGTLHSGRNALSTRMNALGGGVSSVASSV